MSTKKERMYERIENHGEKLLVIFPNASEQDPILLSKAALKLERFIHQAELDDCNGTASDESVAKREEAARRRFQKLFGTKLEGDFFINGDARGYTLKVKDSAMRKQNIDLPRDWGGYGIIAPDLTED